MSTTKHMTDNHQATHIWVAGNPKPQGSKSFKGIRNGRAIMVESSKALPAWRAAVQTAAAQAWQRPPITGPVAVILQFWLPRPQSLPSTKPTPPATKRVGDIDKLARAILDALTAAEVWHDDAQVTTLIALKRISEKNETPGVHITVKEKQ